MDVNLPGMEKENEDEESFFEGFIVDQEKLKQIKDKLVIIAQQHVALATEIHSTSKVINNSDETDTTHEEILTSEEMEVNSFLQWDTSDLLEEAERRWELTEAMVLPSPISELDIIAYDLNNLKQNQFSTPMMLEEKNIEEGVQEEEEGECSRIDEFSFLGFDRRDELNVPIEIHINEEDRPYTRSRGILVTGHSWVQDLEDGFSPVLMPGMEVVFRAYPGITLNRLKHKITQILNPTYTHMMVCIIITEAYRKVPISNREGDRNYWVIVPNLNYDNAQFCRNFSDFKRHCTDVCPVNGYPQRIKNIYNSNREFSPPALHKQCVDQHSYIRTLRSDQYQFVDKNTYPVMYVAQAVAVGKIISDGLFHRVEEVERGISSGVSNDERPREVSEEVRGEIEPQAGPSGISQQGLNEGEEIVEEQLAEREELESMVVEEPEMERLVVPSEVVEAEEEVQKEDIGGEVQEEDGTTPDREMRELSIEEGSSRTSRKRNFSPISFPSSVEPAWGVGPMRNREVGWRTSRGNPANRCSRKRVTPYERSTMAKQNQKGLVILGKKGRIVRQRDFFNGWGGMKRSFIGPSSGTPLQTTTLIDQLNNEFF
ncbi:hypothetical protein Anas_13865 [Armadillidium nasatum]|uniref:Uncharacterized protein n=1 Tax=Armadillidium nasatum TaxID=96803 RepID=A0A5N5T9A9_9CRUS|nr:hypothetical protein Anas_13865 [Armadillidium nasatum]